MEKDSWEKVYNLYEECVELPKEARLTFIMDRTQEDENLRELLIGLLENDSESEDYFLSLQQKIALSFQDSKFEILSKDDEIKDYRVIEEIGSGGTSVVYRASRIDQQFEKDVAIKVFKKKVGDIDKSKEEKQFLATLHHRSIAQIYDGGTLSSGYPYIIMELVDGQPLNLYLIERKLSETARLKLFLNICEAVREAHKNLILHLDLKPNNLIVSQSGELKLLDFGIAQNLKDGEVDDKLSKLTFNFAAPEQFNGQRLSVATDIYQLGKILFFLLINDEIGKEFSNRNPTAIDIGRVKSSELAAIVSKCTMQDPKDRYESTDQLIQEIANYIKNYPVKAYSGSGTYVLSKYIRRNRVPVSLMALFVISVMTGIFFSVREARVATLEKQRAEEAAAIANSTKNFVFNLFEEADPSNTKGDTTNIYDFLQKSLLRIEEYGGQPAVKAEMYAMIASSFRSIDDLDRAELALNKANKIFDSLGISGSRSNIILLDNLALYHRDNGNYDKAADLYERLFVVADELKIEKDSIYSSYLKNYSYIQKTRGLVDSSYQLIAQTAKLEREILSDTVSMLYAETLYIKGSIEKDLNMYAKAEKTLENALELVVSIEGEYHPGTQAILNSLGIIYERLGKYEEAREAFTRKVKIIDKVYGFASRNMAIALDNYSVLQLHEEKYDSALYYSKLATQVFGKIFEGRPNYKYANSIVNLGNSFHHLGELDSADFYMQKGLEMLNEAKATKRDKAFAYYKLANNKLAKKDTIASLNYFDTCIQLRKSMGINTDEVEKRKEQIQANWHQSQSNSSL